MTHLLVLLTFVRIYSGTLKKGDALLNATKGKRERVGRMMMMHSNNREEIEIAHAGDIVALAGMKETTTGDTLCDTANPVVLETMTFPDPVIEIAVEPKSKNDQEKMSLGLQRLGSRGSIIPGDNRFGIRSNHHAWYG